MRIKQIALTLVMIMAIGAGWFGAPQAVLADHGRTARECERISDPAEQRECLDHAQNNPGGRQETTPSGSEDCEGVQISVAVGCEDSENVIFSYLAGIIRFLSVGIGLIVVLMIIISGIQYITSSGNPEATAAAKKKLLNAIFGLLIFIFLAAIANFLIPGGIV